MGDEGLEARVTALEARVAQLQDELAVMRLINSWGPAVDTGSSQHAADLWAQDGVLDSDLNRLRDLMRSGPWSRARVSGR